MSTLSLAISPCPNDTLMFDALVNSGVNTLDLSFQTEYHDIEQLNQGLLKGKWDIAKMSVALFPAIRRDYVMLCAGMALGSGNGPLVVAKDAEMNLSTFEGTMLIPGQRTTAFLLLKRFFPNISHIREILFSDILNNVAGGDADAGLIIHESRFTYTQHGLHCLADMGALWQKQTSLPLPLGAIVMRRSLGDEIIQKTEDLIRQSVISGRSNPDAAMPFIRQHAQETDPEVILKHIELYVNEFSVHPGKDGKMAIIELLKSLPENHSLSLSDIFMPWES